MKQARLGAAFLGVCLWAAAPGESVRGVVDSVREALRLNRNDGQIAHILHRIKLAERLDDRTVETLESEGAGPRAVAELLRLRDASAALPPPAEPAIEAPPPPSAQEQQRVWEAARANSIRSTDSLPDFICTEVVRRYKDPEGKGHWHLADTLVVKLTYFERREQYDLVSINNHATRLDYEQTGGAITEGEFGSLLSAIFAASSRTAFHWDHWTTLRKRPALVYAFRIPVEHSSYRMAMGTSSGYRDAVVVGQHGFLYIDRDTSQVVRVATEADNIPSDFPARSSSTLLDYGFTAIGGSEYLLPLHAETRLDTLPLQHRNEVEFLDYKKFSSDATITYQPPAPTKKK